MKITTFTTIHERDVAFITTDANAKLCYNENVSVSFQEKCIVDEQQPDVWQLQVQLDIQGLVRALASEDANIRKRAAAALRTIGAKDAIPSLRAAYAAESDGETRSALASALETLTDERPTNEEAVADAAEDLPIDQDMVRHLLQQLQSTDPDLVVNAARELGELGDKIAVEPLVLLFNDPKVTIQIKLAVAEALLKLESAPVEVALLANLRHTDWHIRRNGAAILGKLKAEWAIIPLGQALRDPHPQVRRTAHAALIHIGTPEARRILAQFSPNNVDDRRRRPLKPSETAEEADLQVDSDSDTPITAPRGGLLQRVDQPDTDQLKPNKMGTKPLDRTQLPESASSRRHFEVTQPLDPNMLDEFEKRAQESEVELGEPGEDDDNDDNEDEA